MRKRKAMTNKPQTPISMDMERVRPKYLRPPKEPTLARPGSPEKIEALRKRVENGEYLWHPDDAGMPLVDKQHTEPGIVKRERGGCVDFVVSVRINGKRKIKCFPRDCYHLAVIYLHKVKADNKSRYVVETWDDTIGGYGTEEEEFSEEKDNGG